MAHDFFKASDLVYKDYKENTKSTNDDPNVRTGTERALLARTEKWEMVDFINHYAKIHYWETHPGDVKSCQDIEKLIREELPGDIRQHDKVIDWLEKKYTY